MFFHVVVPVRIDYIMIEKMGDKVTWAPMASEWIAWAGRVYKHL